MVRRYWISSWATAAVRTTRSSRGSIVIAADPFLFSLPSLARNMEGPPDLWLKDRTRGLPRVGWRGRPGSDPDDCAAPVAARRAAPAGRPGVGTRGIGDDARPRRPEAADEQALWSGLRFRRLENGDRLETYAEPMPRLARTS